MFEWLVEDTFAAGAQVSEKQLELKRTLKRMSELVQLNCPLVLKPSRVIEEPVYLFKGASTDGSVDGKPLLGAHLVDSEGVQKVTSFAPQGVETLRIEVLEALAVILAVDTWRDILENKALFLFVDSAIVMHLLVKCHSRQAKTIWVAEAILLELHAMQTSMWVEYVPSELNPADFPSRAEKYHEKFLDIFQPEQNIPNTHLTNRWARACVKNDKYAVKGSHQKSDENPGNQNSDAELGLIGSDVSDGDTRSARSRKLDTAKPLS